MAAVEAEPLAMDEAAALLQRQAQAPLPAARLPAAALAGSAGEDMAG